MDGAAGTGPGSAKLAGVSAPPGSPLADATASTLLGSYAFVDRMRAWRQDRLAGREVPAARELPDKKLNSRLSAIEKVLS